MSEPQTITMQVERITPAIAAHYLNQNEKNRRLSRTVVSRYVEAINRGEWVVNGEAIKFGWNGNLLDGQHRLRACILADKSIDVCVVRGLDPEVFKTLDEGKGRKGGDCLYVLEYPNPLALAAACRMLFAYERGWTGYVRGYRKVSNDELLGVIKRHRKLVPFSGVYMKKPVFSRLIPHSVGMFAFYVASMIDENEAFRFFTEFATGRYNRPGDKHPPKVLRERLEQTAREAIRPTSEVKMAWVVEAWNHHQAGRPLHKLSRLVENPPRFAHDPIKRIR